GGGGGGGGGGGRVPGGAGSGGARRRALARTIHEWPALGGLLEPVRARGLGEPQAHATLGVDAARGVEVLGRLARAAPARAEARQCEVAMGGERSHPELVGPAERASQRRLRPDAIVPFR